MKKTKRILSLALAILMIFSVCSISVGALETVSVKSPDRDSIVYWPTFKNKAVKSVHLALFDERITKIKDGAVGKVYYCPDERIQVVGNPPEIVAQDNAYDDIEKYWQNPEFYKLTGKIKYIGEITAKDMYIGKKDYTDFGSFNMIGFADPYNSLHIDLRSLGITENYGDYAIIFEEGSFTSEDGSVVTERIVINEFLDFSESLSGFFKISYFIITLISVYNTKYLTKGY